MAERIEFNVYGVPQTKGSTKAFMPEGARFPIITNDNPRNKSWAALVSSVAQDYAPKDGLWEGAVLIILDFVLTPPKELLKKDRYKTTPMTTKPDWDKIARSCCDALSGIIFKDDKQIIDASVRKGYGLSPGVVITLIHLGDKEHL